MITFRHPVYLWEEGEKVLIPITQSWRKGGIYGEVEN